MRALEREYDAAVLDDKADPLSHYRNRFSIPTDLIYFDGNSLGPLLNETRSLLDRTIKDEWGDQLIRSWNRSWFDLPLAMGDRLSPLIGASPGEVCFADSVTLNLFKLASAVLLAHPQKTTIITDELNFPSDHHALEGLCKLSGNSCSILQVSSEDGQSIPLESFEKAIDETTLFVTTSHVCFKSGFRQDLAELAKLCHRKGTILIADLSHSVGAIPLRLKEWNVDMAVGCSYKYLNGGPGAPAFLYVRKDLQETMESGLSGWFGASQPFEFVMKHKPAEGIRRFLAGTPPILSMAAIEPGIETLIEAGIEDVYAKSVRMSGQFYQLFMEHLEPLGFEWGSPKDPTQRGSHVALRHPKAFEINHALINPSDGWPTIIPDFRKPDNLRIGFAPLINRYTDVVRLVQRIQHILESNEHEKVPTCEGQVT